MKQALIVDEDGAVGDFAAAVLPEAEYELTVVGSLQDGLALVSTAPYQLIIIAKPNGCAEGLWHVVEEMKSMSDETALILVVPRAADASFHARAREVGAVVLGMPMDVASRTALEEAILG